MILLVDPPTSVVSSAAAIYAIAALATAGVIVRPWGVSEALWPAAATVVLVLLGLLPPSGAWQGIAHGIDVYLFLAGMMVLAEVARVEGLFDWLARHAARAARGSPTRLLTLVYVVGIGVTAILSNNATAVVLTPAIAAVVRAAGADQPLPYLFACAFVANAASFVFPIANPANLVIYGSHMPPLVAWVSQYALPSVGAIAATYVALRFTQRHALRRTLAAEVALIPLSPGGRTAAYGITGAAIWLLLASALDQRLGVPTCVAGGVTLAVLATRDRRAPYQVVRGIDWSILVLVAGLFALVEALGRAGAIGAVAGLLQRMAATAPTRAAWGTAGAVAVASNLANNLPVGLVAATAMQSVHLPALVSRAVLVSVDLGPNLSVTGSLATLLWLAALRRDGHDVDAWTFLKVGALVMPPALILAMVAVLRPI